MNSQSFLIPQIKEPNEKNDGGRTCLLVLGMHRSGTSAMTRVLSIAGAKLPTSLMGAGRGNAAGHWESLALLAYHDRLLQMFGSVWSDWRALEVGRLSIERRRDIKKEIADLLECEYGDAELLVVKDPRICRFAPLFIDAVEEAGMRTRIVHMLRNPLEVAESLERRDGSTRTDAVLQWLRHVLDSEATTRTRNRVIISYSALLQDWRGVFERLTQTLQVAWPYTPDDIAPQVAAFLDGTHRHHVYTTEDVLLDPIVRDWVGEAYSALLVLEHNPGSKAAMLVLDAIRQEFDHSAPILRALQAETRVARDKHTADVNAQLGRVNEALEKSGAELAERTGEVKNLATQLNAAEDRARRAAGLIEERDKRIAQLAATLERSVAETERSSAALAESEEKASLLQMSLQTAEGRIAELSAALEESAKLKEEFDARLSEKDTEIGLALSERDSRIGALQRSLAEHDHRISGLQGSLTERADKIDALQRSLGEGDGKIGSLQASLANRNQQIESLKRALAKIEGKETSLKLAVKEREAHIAALYDSTSWRITAPLRLIGRAKIFLGSRLGSVFHRTVRLALRFTPSTVKALVKEALFRAAAPLFRDTQAYRAWRVSKERAGPTDGDDAEDAAAGRLLAGTKVLAYSHNLNGAEGAPTSLFELCQNLQARFGISPVVVSAGDGSLHESYRRAGIPVIVDPRFVSPVSGGSKALDTDSSVEAIRNLIREHAIDVVIANTALGFHFVHAAQSCRVPALWIVRESEHPDEFVSQLELKNWSGIFRRALQSADCLTFVSAHTQDLWMGAIARDEGTTVRVIPNGLNVQRFAQSQRKDRRKLRAKLGLGEDDVVLLSVGTICVRKNQKQLLDALLLLPERSLRRLKVLFVGGGSGPYAQAFRETVNAHPELADRVKIIGPTPDIGDYYLLADAFVLNSILESYPRVVLEAMQFSLPVISNPVFGVREQTQEGVNALYYDPKDTASLAAQLEAILDPDLRRRLAEGSRRLARELITLSGMTARYAEVLLSLRTEAVHAAHRESTPLLSDSEEQRSTEPVASGPSSVGVSVIVPNYNYARYLPERLGSILNQTVAPREIIFLDDASTDNSVDVARSLLARSQIPFRIIRNEKNSGVYRQWLKGVSEAKCDLVWIAEADDTCEPDFLAALIEGMRDDRVAIAYCQSKRIDENGMVTAPDNLQHTDAIDPQRWRRDYHELGVREVVDYLTYRNTIPNVSACLLRKSAMRGIEDRVARTRFCGDHLLYAHMLKSADVAYVARPLNGFRRHGGSVTRGGERSVGLLEELAQVRDYICENFPIHSSQSLRLRQFLDKDYKVTGVAQNTAHPAIAATIRRAEELAGHRRRFAFITTNNGSFDGGSELWWRECAKRLRALGHDVVVLIKKWDPRPPFLADFERLGIKTYFKEDDGFRAILGFRPDLVAVSLGDQDEGTEYYGELRKSNIAYIIVNRLTKETRFWPIRDDRNRKVCEGYLAARKVFFTCWNNHRVMEDRLGCKLPGCDRIFDPCHADRHARLPFPPSSDGLHLAVPANILFEHKGQDLLVEVMTLEKWRQRDVTINFYGGGRDEDRLRMLIKAADLEDRLILHGRIVAVGREHEISRIWKKNHAILMASRMEGFPNMLVNALMSARVPIVTDIGGHTEVIEDGVSGFVAADPTVEALDEAMERAYTRRHDWESIGLRARESILRYLPEDPLEDAVQKVLAAAGVPMSQGSQKPNGRAYLDAVV